MGIIIVIIVVIILLFVFLSRGKSSTANVYPNDAIQRKKALTMYLFYSLTSTNYCKNPIYIEAESKLPENDCDEDELFAILAPFVRYIYTHVDEFTNVFWSGQIDSYMQKGRFNLYPTAPNPTTKAMMDLLEILIFGDYASVNRIDEIPENVCHEWLIKVHTITTMIAPTIPLDSNCSAGIEGYDMIVSKT